jgi:hypothetical protein
MYAVIEGICWTYSPAYVESSPKLQVHGPHPNMRQRIQLVMQSQRAAITTLLR